MWHYLYCNNAVIIDAHAKCMRLTFPSQPHIFMNTTDVNNGLVSFKSASYHVLTFYRILFTRQRSSKCLTFVFQISSTTTNRRNKFETSSNYIYRHFMQKKEYNIQGGICRCFDKITNITCYFLSKREYTRTLNSCDIFW